MNIDNVISLDDKRRARPKLATVTTIDVKRERVEKYKARCKALKELNRDLDAYVRDNFVEEYAPVIGSIVGQEDIPETLAENLWKVKSIKKNKASALVYYGTEDGYDEFGISNGLIGDFAHAFSVPDAQTALEYAALYTSGFIVGSLAVAGTIEPLELAESGDAFDYKKFKEAFDPHRFAAAIFYAVNDLPHPRHVASNPLHMQGLSLPMDEPELRYTASRLYC